MLVVEARCGWSFATARHGAALPFGRHGVHVHDVEGFLPAKTPDDFAFSEAAQGICESGGHQAGGRHLL
jgi:hypothetical protein